jgi:Rieske 2Fe-2S family protein
VTVTPTTATAPQTTTGSDVAPIDPEALALALLVFGESTMLPAAAYTDPAVLAWEQRHFFAGTWCCVGRVEDLAIDDGGRSLSQRALMVGDIPVLLTMTSGGTEVRAFANTCRHRGHELLPDGGTANSRAVTCPYHAWSYGLDGAVIAAPEFNEVATFDRSRYGLVPLPVELWHGWVFINATGTAAPFADHLGVLDELVAPYAPEKLLRLARHSYEIAANWKIATENYHECYHCPLIHPELCQVSPPTSGDNYDLPGAWVGGSMELAPDAVTMSLSGASAGIPIEGVNPREVIYLGLFPNLLISVHPDYMMTHRFVALAPDRTWIECSWFFPSADVDPAYAVDFWDLTNRQDWGACESVQRGLASPHFSPGPLAPSEDAVHQFVTMVGRGYQGVAPHVQA